MNYEQAYEAFGDSALPLSVVADLEVGFGAGRRDNRLCVMQLAAWVAGEENTDRPICVEPLLSEFAIKLNDGGGHGLRQALKSRIPTLINTANPALKNARVISFLQSIAGNLCEILIEIKGDHREKFAAYVSAFNIIASEAVDAEDMLAEIPKLGGSGGAVDLGNWSYDCPEGVISNIAGRKFGFTCIEDFLSCIADWFGNIDDFFSTDWCMASNQNPNLPQPGARALAAFDRAIAVGRVSA